MSANAMELNDVFLKLDKMNDTVGDMRVMMATMAAHTEINSKELAEHIRRTELLEKSVALLETDIKSQRKAIQILMWGVGAFQTIVAAVFGAIQLVNYLKP